MSWEDIAKQMGISDTRVQQLFNAAILKIKSMLKEPEFTDIRAEFCNYLSALDSDRTIESGCYHSENKKPKGASR